MTDLHDHSTTESEAVKSVTEEAWLLLAALSGGAQGSSSVGDGSRDDDVCDSADGAEGRCPNTWCPVCAAATFVRQNPAILRNVTSSAASLLRAWADAIDQASQTNADRTNVGQTNAGPTHAGQQRADR